jgi:hypothetical protein
VTFADVAGWLRVADGALDAVLVVVEAPVCAQAATANARAPIAALVHSVLIMLNFLLRLETEWR